MLPNCWEEDNWATCQFKCTFLYVSPQLFETLKYTCCYQKLHERWILKFRTWLGSLHSNKHDGKQYILCTILLLVECSNFHMIASLLTTMTLLFERLVLSLSSKVIYYCHLMSFDISITHKHSSIALYKKKDRRLMNALWRPNICALPIKQDSNVSWFSLSHYCWAYHVSDDGSII